MSLEQQGDTNKSVRYEPGTPEARLYGLAEFAKKECGYNDVMAKPFELFIYEKFEEMKKRIRELEKKIERYKEL